MRFIIYRTALRDSYGSSFPFRAEEDAAPPCDGTECHDIEDYEGNRYVYYTLEIADLDALLAFNVAHAGRIVIEEPSIPDQLLLGEEREADWPLLPWLEIYDDYRE